jgi:hypothetical protein
MYGSLTLACNLHAWLTRLWMLICVISLTYPKWWLGGPTAGDGRLPSDDERLPADDQPRFTVGRRFTRIGSHFPDLFLFFCDKRATFSKLNLRNSDTGRRFTRIHIIRMKVFKNESIKDMKWCVRQDGSWRNINNDLDTMNHASKKSKREFWRRGTECDGESWCRGTECDGEGQMDVHSKESCYYEESYITKYQSLLNQDMKWRRYQIWKLTIQCEVLQVTTSKSQCQNKIKYADLH